MIILHFHLQPQFKCEFIYTSHQKVKAETKRGCWFFSDTSCIITLHTLHVWLHSSVGRASHRYFTEVMGLNPDDHIRNNVIIISFQQEWVTHFRNFPQMAVFIGTQMCSAYFISIWKPWVHEVNVEYYAHNIIDIARSHSSSQGSASDRGKMFENTDNIACSFIHLYMEE